MLRVFERVLIYVLRERDIGEVERFCEREPWRTYKRVRRMALERL